MPASRMPLRRTREQPHKKTQLQPSTSRAATTNNRTRNRVDSSVSNESILAEEDNETQNTLTQIDRRELTKNVAQFILASTSNKGFVREQDLKKLFETRNKEARETDIAATSNNLKEVFGYEMYLEPKNARYFLCTDLQLPCSALIDKIVGVTGNNNHMTAPKDKNSMYKDGVLVSALMFIFMVKRHLHEVIDKEDGIGINMLREFLNEIGVIKDDVFASWFGPSRTAEFLLQGWIECIIKRDISGEEEVSYNWGSRAETIVDKKQMLESFCNVYGSHVEAWSRHAAASGIKIGQTLEPYNH